MLTITRQAWKAFAPKCPDAYTAALFDNMGVLEDAGILDSELRWCHFAATVYHETGGFTELRENLNYTTTKALRAAWPSRFGHRTDAELKPLLRNPVGLADQVYGCYSKRDASVIGNVGPGEAYLWRGGGWFNTTFKPSVDGYCRKLGIDPTPANALDDPVLTLRFAVLEWTETNCNKWADENQIRKVAKAINTGSATSGVEPVGMDSRKEAFARAWKQWGESGEAEKPAKGVSIGGVVTKAVAPALVVTEGVRQTVQSAPDPAPALATARKTIEHASEVKAVAVGAGDLLSWGFGNLKLLIATGLAMLAIWLGPVVWRHFR